jgi:hypothetical protein
VSGFKPVDPGLRWIKQRPGRKRRPVAEEAMREIIRTNDTVLVSAVGALLQSAGIPHLVFDQNMSVLEGSLGILPRRILVPEAHNTAARRLLKDAGYAHELLSQTG